MLNIVPDRYCGRHYAYALAAPTLPTENFAGIRVAMEQLGSSGLESRLKHMVMRMAADGSRPDTVIMNPEQYARLVEILGKPHDRAAGVLAGLPSRDPLAVGIAATVAISALGLLIARRNAVMAEEGPSDGWLKAFIEWACEFVRALFATQAPALPAHEESDAA